MVETACRGERLSIFGLLRRIHPASGGRDSDVFELDEVGSSARSFWTRRRRWMLLEAICVRDWRLWMCASRSWLIAVIIEDEIWRS